MRYVEVFVFPLLYTTLGHKEKLYEMDLELYHIQLFDLSCLISVNWRSISYLTGSK